MIIERQTDGLDEHRAAYMRTQHSYKIVEQSFGQTRYSERGDSAEHQTGDQSDAASTDRNNRVNRIADHQAADEICENAGQATCRTAQKHTCHENRQIFKADAERSCIEREKLSENDAQCGEHRHDCEDADILQGCGSGTGILHKNTLLCTITLNAQRSVIFPLCLSGMRKLHRKRSADAFRPFDNSPFEWHFTRNFLLCGRDYASARHDFGLAMLPVFA